MAIEIQNPKKFINELRGRGFYATQVTKTIDKINLKEKIEVLGFDISTSIFNVNPFASLTNNELCAYTNRELRGKRRQIFEEITDKYKKNIKTND